MKKLKITCIIHSLNLGGMERVMAILLNSFMQKDNTEISLILIGKSPKIEFDIPKKIKVYTPGFDFNPNKRNLCTFKTIQFIRKSIREINPDTILSFGEYWNNLVLLSLIGLKHPVYISDRSQPNKNLGRLQNKLRDKLYPNAAGYIAQTKMAGDIARKNKWSTNIEIIGNPINQVTDDYTMEKENIVLTVGRLIKTKHIDELIEIFKLIDRKDWKLIIVGGNAKNMKLLEKYKQLVNDWGMDERVQLVGAQSDVAAYYKKAKVFAFTSSSEGFPNVIGEAMSYGLPVIAYNCNAGPADLIIDGQTGFLIEERNQNKYTENLDRLMEDADLRIHLGEKGRKRINEFNSDRIAEKFFNFITK